MSDERILTPEGKKKLEQELEELKNVKLKEIAKRIERAKELGDLSENAEYHEAKDAMAWAQTRRIEIEEIIKKSTVVAHSGTTERVEIGSHVSIETHGRKRTFFIVGATEADPASGKISVESPLGKALIGRKKAEQITIAAPVGTLTYTILEIT